MRYLLCYFINILYALFSLLVNCLWGNWSDTWSSCNASCGDSGFQMKNRSTLQDSSNGGKNCTGGDIKYQECNTCIVF